MLPQICLENNTMKITLREILASISIIAIMLLFGVVISGNIAESQMDKNEKYNKAIKINNHTSLFQYGMDTNVGNAFVHGELIAVDAVTFPEVGGEYMYVEKVKERHTMHTRTVTQRIGKITTTRTENYWTWDKVGSEEKKSKKVMFSDIEFNTKQFKLPSSTYMTTLKESSKIRYKYYVVEKSNTGTIFAYLSDGNISKGKDKVPFYKNMTIEETVESLESKGMIILFWVFWIALTGFLVVGFYYLDNNWLE